MKPSAYYNEIDTYAAQWLRNLIAAGHIADGVVDERSIEDVHPNDLRGFTQCHFFAGIGVWSYALRRAGWPDDRPVWTGSCPCQPFSSAGKGAGFADERHLWPAWFHLISKCRPAVVVGEQVASKDAGPWIDLVQDDLEAMGYAFGAVAFPSAGVGAPHIRDRAYWVAHARSARLEGRNARSLGHQRASAERGGAAGRMGDPHRSSDRPQEPTASDRQQEADRPTDQPSGSVLSPGGPADTERSVIRGGGLGAAAAAPRGVPAAHGQRQWLRPDAGAGGAVVDGDRAGPTNGLWRTADWLLCRDGRWRPVEPGTQPLATGIANRVGRLRAYGNAINAEAAHAFIAAYLESEA